MCGRAVCIASACWCCRALWGGRLGMTFGPCLHWSPIQLQVEWQAGGEAVSVVWWWICSTHTGCGGGAVECHGVPFGVVQYYWHCLWTSGGRSKFPWGIGWCCCGCVLVPPFWSIEMHTSGSWELLGIFYLMDVFHVLYKVICAPPPILLVLHLSLTIGIYVWFSTGMHVNTFENDRLHPEPDDAKNSLLSRQRG